MRKPFACALLLLLQALPAVSQSAQSHQNRAVSLLLNQAYEEAIPELRQAAALYEKEGAYTRYFDCLNQLSEAYLSTNQAEAAKQTAKSALWESMQLLGRDNPQAATAAHHLAKAYSTAGRYSEAIQFHQMGLDIRTEMHGKLHAAVVASLRKLSTAEREAGRFKLAEEHLKEGLRLLATIFHPEHAEVAELRYLLGQLKQESGDLPDAREQYGAALRILEREGRPGSLKGELLLRLAGMSSGEEQRALYEEALPYLSSQGLQPDEAALQGLLYMTEKTLRDGQAEQAVRYASYALQFVPAKAMLSDTESNLCLRMAEGLLALGRLQEALAVFENIWKVEGIQLPEPLAVASCQLAIWAGQPEKALRWADAYESRAEASPLALARLNALLATGKAEAVTVQAGTLRPKLSPELQPEADYLEGCALLQTNKPQAARACFQRGLQQPGIPAWAKARLLGGSLRAYHASGEPVGAEVTAALQNFQSAIRECLNGPLMPLQAERLRQLQSEVQPAALGLLHALYAARPSEVQLVYEWMEQAAFHRMYTEIHGLRKGEQVTQQYYEMLQGRTAEDVSAQAFPENARYTLWGTGTLSWQSLQSVCRESKTQALYFQQTEDFVYCLMAGRGAGSFRRFPLLANWPQQLPNPQEGWTAVIAEELQRSAGQLEKLLIVPGVGLELFPFELLSGQDGRLGETFALIRHGSATTWQLDANSTAVLPPAAGPYAYVVGKEKPEKAKQAIAMPTGQPAIDPGENWLLNWVQQQGGRTLEAGSQYPVLAFAAIDPTAMQEDWPKARLTAISLENRVPSSGSLYSCMIWQQMKGAGAYLICPSYHHSAETGQRILRQWQSGERPIGQAAQAAMSSTGEVHLEEAPPVVFTFGAAAGRRAGGRIPAYLVLGAVASVMLLGVLAKR